MAELIDSGDYIFYAARDRDCWYGLWREINFFCSATVVGFYWEIY